MKTFHLNEKLFNKILGLNIILWGIAGLLSSLKDDISAVRLCITIINFVVGFLIFFRKKAIITTSVLSNPHWIIVLVCNGVIFRISHPLHQWSFATEFLFVFGALFTIISFFYLGSNFSIRPSARGVSSLGTYKIVRHPCYLGESLMTLACVIASNNYYALLIFVLLLAFQAWRILEEEKILQSLPEYIRFCEKIKWRLIPFVW